jgi:hypothetical protein
MLFSDGWSDRPITCDMQKFRPGLGNSKKLTKIKAGACRCSQVGSTVSMTDSSGNVCYDATFTPEQKVETDSESANCGRHIGHDVGHRCTIRKATSLITLGVCVLGSGCRSVGVRTVWSAEARSPDGLWIASARTEQHSGFGSAGVETIVCLKRTTDSLPPRDVLGFFHDPSNQSPTINLTMRWATSSHLDVTYSGRADLNFKAVKYAGIEISVRDLSLSGETTIPSQ